MRLLAPLHDLTAEELDHVGGKAASLARLTHAGLPVPPGVALTDAALRLFLEHNKLVDDLERFERAGRIELAAGLRHRVNAGVMPPALAGALRAACGGLGDRLVVRSSALGEDGKERSFAGQLSTLLNVRQGDALEAAVRRCWASLFADRVHVPGRRGPGRRAPGHGRGDHAAHRRPGLRRLVHDEPGDGQLRGDDLRGRVWHGRGAGLRPGHPRTSDLGPTPPPAALGPPRRAPAGGGPGGEPRRAAPAARARLV
ncbi:MAG: hypothetical protein IPN01_30040 [Deltaproteobacteria bacterium]|nr:hypothetical protein [Deltaproteobacteria bacterium]